jgi:hypothetical protein
MDMSKDLVAASATPLVLAILAEGDSYGYAIIKRVAELSADEQEDDDGKATPCGRSCLSFRRHGLGLRSTRLQIPSAVFTAEARQY